MTARASKGDGAAIAQIVARRPVRAAALRLILSMMDVVFRVALQECRTLDNCIEK